MSAPTGTPRSGAEERTEDVGAPRSKREGYGSAPGTAAPEPGTPMPRLDGCLDDVCAATGECLDPGDCWSRHYVEDGLDDGSDMDPCNYCPHDNTDHRGDGCIYCGCDVPQ